jgi:hypothetical protein
MRPEIIFELESGSNRSLPTYCIHSHLHHRGKDFELSDLLYWHCTPKIISLMRRGILTALQGLTWPYVENYEFRHSTMTLHSLAFDLT